MLFTLHVSILLRLFSGELIFIRIDIVVLVVILVVSTGSTATLELLVRVLNDWPESLVISHVLGPFHGDRCCWFAGVFSVILICILEVILCISQSRVKCSNCIIMRVICLSKSTLIS